MDFDVSLIISGLIFSGVGFVYFTYGRKQKKTELLVLGIVLMVYPYFVSSLIVSICIGAILSLLPFLLRWW